MNVDQLIRNCESEGILLILSDDGMNLEVEGERKLLSAEFVEDLKKYKPHILEHLRADLLDGIKASTFRWAGDNQTKCSEKQSLSSNAFVDRRKNGTVCSKCKSDKWRDVIIHQGNSTRRDCIRCDRLICFPVWYGETGLFALDIPNTDDVLEVD